MPSLPEPGWEITGFPAKTECDASCAGFAWTVLREEGRFELSLENAQISQHEKMKTRQHGPGYRHRKPQDVSQQKPNTVI